MKLKEKIIELIIQHLPKIEYLSLENIEQLGILGRVPRMNLAHLRAKKRGPEYLKRNNIYLYNREKFIDWLRTNVNVHVTDIKRD